MSALEARRRVEGRCISCGGKPTPEHVTCAECRAEATEKRASYRPVASFPIGARVRVWKWVDSPSGNPPDVARLPPAKMIGKVAKPGGAEGFYTVDFPTPYGRLQVQESEMVRVE
jgi:hypothetical protein